MTNEAKDLRSALLLEQASYCYLMSNPPLVRKYAFHIILSGYRFSKSGQKKHSSRAYRQGFQVYKGRGWELSENHILYTLGHQSLLLKDHYTASSLFNELVATTNSSKIQQMCHLREFFIVHHMREKEDKATATITIPFFQSQKSILDLTSESQSYEKLLEDTSWLDSDVLDHVKVHLNCQSVFGPLSQNLQIPQVAVDQSLRLLLPVSNPFQTPLLMRKVRLIWKFEIAADEKAILSSDSEAGNFIKMEPIDNVKIEKETPLVLDLNLVPLKSGQLSIEGIEYSLKALFPQSESTDYTIKGKQPLNVQGPRLNSTKDQKISKTPLYMKDSRLSLKIVEKLPKLKVQLKIPESLYQGQIYGVDVNFENVGNAPISQICLIHQNPGLLSLDNIENSTFSQEETIYDITKMELELAPGSQITKKLWICARKMENNFVYFSYNSPGEKGRLLKQSLSLKILPSMEVKAIQIQPCLHDDHGCLLAHITSSMEAIFIEQISMVSSRKRLKSLVSSNENQSISNGETSVIGCQIEKFEGEFVEISTLKASNSNEKNLNSTPFINFCPKFDKDLDILAVLWRNKQGQNGLIYTKITEENDEKSDQIDNLSSTESVDFPLIPSPKKACSVQAKVTQKNIKHDFDQDPLCLVPFEVEVENFLPTESIFRYKTTENGGADFGAQKFAGCNKATIPFDAESRQKLCFFVAVSSPGLFSYAGLSYQMTEKNEECDDDEYIPIQVNFLVE